MEPPGGRDSRFMGYSNNILHDQASEIYGNPNLGRPSTSIQQLSPRHTMVSGNCGGGGARALKTGGEMCYDERSMSTQGLGMDPCVNDMSEDTYGALQSKKSPPNNGKKTKGRVKIKMEYIENKLRRYTTFSKRKTGIMKKAYELSTLTGTQVMLLVASETGHVYTFATRKLQPMITSEAGKALIQTCLNSPDPPAGSTSGDQRMSATGFEETELTYNISDEESKDENMSPGDSSDSSDGESPELEIKDEPSVITAASKTILSQSQTLTTTSPITTTSATASTKPQQQQSQQPQQTSSLPSSSSSSSPATSSQASILPPLVYQTAQGMMYATPSNGSVIFSLAQGDPNLGHAQQLIIPLSVMTANGQGELDLSKRK